MRFVLLGKIGQGAMGAVYKALDTWTGEIVAVKVLPARTAALEELRKARKVTHPNVCRVFDFHPEGDQLFISMEYLDGETLRSYMDRVGRLDEEKMMRIVDPLIDALEEAHRQGILHLDLKPENIMILKDGEPKLMDFGVARYMDPKGVMADRIGGTPTHMAPEQLARKPADVRTDIYSFGLILYEMVTGRPAFAGDSAGELFQQHLVGSPAGLRQSVDLPAHIAMAIFRCLEKEPSRRPQSFSELRNALIHGAAALPAPPVKKSMLLPWILAIAFTFAAFAVALQTGESPKPVAPVMASASKVLPPLLPRSLDKSLDSIAIFPFDNLTRDPHYKSFERSIVESLTDSFVHSGRFRVIERSRLNELIATRPAADRQEMGRVVGANFVMFGSFEVILGEITIFAQIESTESAEAVFTDTITGDLKDARTVEERFAGEMIAHLKAFKR